MIIKKLEGEKFGWDPNAFNGKGYWYAMDKKGGLGRAATKEEMRSLNKPSNDEVDPVSPEVHKMGYYEARYVRRSSLKSLINQNLYQGKGVGASIKGAISDKFKAKVKGIKEKFDPLNFFRFISRGNPLAFAMLGGRAFGKLTGRKQEDIDYFMGRGTPTTGKKKRATATAALFASVPSDRIKPVQKNDSITDVVSKIYGLFKKSYAEKITKDELNKNFQKQREDKAEKRHKELLKALSGIGGTGKATATEKEKTWFEIILDLLGNAWSVLKSFGARIARFFVGVITKAKEFFGIAVKWVKNVATTIFETVKGWVSKAVDFVVGLAKKIGKWVMSGLSYILPDKVMKVLETGVSKLTEGVSNISEKLSNAKLFKSSGAEVAQKGAEKVTEKAATKGAFRAGLKALPVLGLGAGIFFGVKEALRGNWLGAGLELSSGLAGSIPGVGTAAELGLSAAAIAQESSFDDEEESTATPVPTSKAPTSSAPVATSSVPVATSSAPVAAASTTKPPAAAAVSATPMAMPNATSERAIAAINENVDAQTTQVASVAMPIVMNNSNSSTIPASPPKSASDGPPRVRNEDESLMKSIMYNVRTV